MEADLKNDRLRVRYDPARVSVARLLEVIGEQGFEGKVLPAGGVSP